MLLPLPIFLLAVVTKNLVHIESIDVGAVPLVSSYFARGVNAAGDRVRVERESLLAGQAQGDAAGGGREPPGALAFALPRMLPLAVWARTAP